MNIIKSFKNISLGSLALLVCTGAFAQRNSLKEKLNATSRGNAPQQNQPQAQQPQRDNRSPLRPSRPSYTPAPAQSAPAQSTGRVSPLQRRINPTGSVASNYQPQSSGSTPSSGRYGYNNNGYNNNYNNNYHNNGYGYNNYNRGRSYRYYYGGAYHPYPHYYRPYTAPSFGVQINVLPRGYYGFRVGRSRYYYYGGTYYQPYGGYYRTILPPIGAIVPILPGGAYPIVINDLNYYEYGGTYYQSSYNRPGSYEVVGVNGYLKSDLPPASDEGDIISDASVSTESANLLTTLPENFKTVTLNNITYYVSPAGEYYTKNIDEKGEVTYRVAALETPGK